MDRNDVDFRIYGPGYYLTLREIPKELEAIKGSHSDMRGVNHWENGLEEQGLCWDDLPILDAQWGPSEDSVIEVKVDGDEIYEGTLGGWEHTPLFNTISEIMNKELDGHLLLVEKIDRIWFSGEFEADDFNLEDLTYGFLTLRGPNDLYLSTLHRLVYNGTPISLMRDYQDEQSEVEERMIILASDLC